MNKTAEEQPTVDDKQSQADFDAGVAMETVPEPKTPPQPDGQQPRDDAGRFASPPVEPKKKGAEKPPEKPTEKPEYVQITKQQFEQWEAAAKRTNEFEKQLSKAFGTIGDVQKIVKMLQAQTPKGIAVKIPDTAFAAMEKDFPELAKHTRDALEATLKGLEGTGGAAAQIDTTAFEQKVEERVLKYAAEDLEDVYPDWQKIVGAVDLRKGEMPDPNNAFRKWLTTKDQAYQDRINGTNSAGVITRAIRAFKSETKVAPAAPAAPSAQELKAKASRANRIKDAVRPKGDGGQPPVKNADDEFLAGYNSG